VRKCRLSLKLWLGVNHTGELLRYIQRDLSPQHASSLVPPKSGVIRAGNGLYWTHGLVRSEKTASVVPQCGSAPTTANHEESGRSGGGWRGAWGARNAPTRQAAREGCVVLVRSQDNVEGGVPKAMQNMAAAKVRLYFFPLSLPSLFFFHSKKTVLNATLPRHTGVSCERWVGSVAGADICSVCVRCPVWKAAPAFVMLLERAAVSLMVKDGRLSAKEAEQWGA
jgi:hypothetical protein